MNLTDKIFHDDEAARVHLEAQRWPNGAYCPHCGEAEAVTLLGGKSTKPGTYICKSCRTKFTVTVGTLFERSHIGLAKWMLAFRLMAASKKGVSAHQLHRSLGVTYKTAWFMAHRIRAAMAEENGAPRIAQKLKARLRVNATEPFFNRLAGRPRSLGTFGDSPPLGQPA